MIEVFKTNVDSPHKASELSEALTHRFVFSRVSFDLDDCDRILRIAGDAINAGSVIAFVNQRGFECALLSD